MSGKKDFQNKVVISEGLNPSIPLCALRLACMQC